MPIVAKKVSELENETKTQPGLLSQWYTAGCDPWQLAWNYWSPAATSYRIHKTSKPGKRRNIFCFTLSCSMT